MIELRGREIDKTVDSPINERSKKRTIFFPPNVAISGQIIIKELSKKRELLISRHFSLYQWCLLIREMTNEGMMEAEMKSVGKFCQRNLVNLYSRIDRKVRNIKDSESKQV